MPTVFIPSLLQKFTGDRKTVEVEASTVRQVIEALEQACPGIKERLVENGGIVPSISVAIDGEVTTLGMIQKVGEHSEVHFLPAIAGGSR